MDMTDQSLVWRMEESFVLTIFGASGDLAKIKIFPAILSLAEQNRLPAKFFIIGYARTQMSADDFRQMFAAAAREHYEGQWGDFQQKVLDSLLPKIYYFAGSYDDASDFAKYKTWRDDLTGERLLQLSYFSVPPVVFGSIVDGLAGIREPGDEVRLIIEKPFGTDENSARDLFHLVGRRFDEGEVYLLDHYLGKKAVRSILPLRHVNRILNLMMKGAEVANIQVTAIETVGVNERLGYFDKVGTIRDMVQSHLLQILALVTMSIPIDTSAQSIHREKQAILSALKFYPGDNTLSLGQYEGYREQSAQTKDSQTPTFAALKMFINRESWFEVPIFLRTGKKLRAKNTYIVVELKKFPFQSEKEEPNRLIIELFPDEKLHIRLLDAGGLTMRAEEIVTSESIACEGDWCLPAHGVLLLDVLRGDKRHFLSFAEILAAWQLTDEVLDFVESGKVPVELYGAGSCGPKGQLDLMSGVAARWYDYHEEGCDLG